MNRIPMIRCGILVCCALVCGSCNGFVPDPLDPIDPEVARERADWTILVYMPAESSLEGLALTAINQMEAGIGPDTGVHIVVLVDRSAKYNSADGNWTGTRLYEIVSDSSMSSIASTRLGDPDLGVSATQDIEKDLSDPQVFKEFLQFGSEYFPSENTALILWGYSEGISGEDHAQNWYGRNPRAIGYDESSRRQLLSIQEIASAVSGHDLEFIGFDAPMTGLIEFAYEFVDRVPFYAGSQDSQDAQKWDYQSLLSSFNETDRTVEDLLASVEESYRQGASDSSASISMIKTASLPELVSRFHAFSDAASGSIDQGNRAKTRSELFHLQDWGYVSPGDLQLDIVGMARHFQNSSIAVTEANALASSVEDAVYSTWNKKQAFHMNGLSVFFVGLLFDGAPASSMPEIYDADRAGLKFIAEGGWAPNSKTGSGLLAAIWETNQ